MIYLIVNQADRSRDTTRMYKNKRVNCTQYELLVIVGQPDANDNPDINTCDKQVVKVAIDKNGKVPPKITEHGLTNGDKRQLIKILNNPRQLKEFL